MTIDHRDVEKVLDADGPRVHFEGKLRDLHDRRLTMVDYWDVHNFGPEPASWDHGDWHHAVMGVQLGTDVGPVTVTWTSTFIPTASRSSTSRSNITSCWANPAPSGSARTRTAGVHGLRLSGR